MKSGVYSIAGIATILLIAFLWLGNFVLDAPEAEKLTENVTISGTYLCVPVADQTARESDCAVGIRTQEGAYYALDLGLLATGAPALVEGDTVRASGIITPVEALSTDYWQRYPVSGIFSVTSSLEVTHNEAEKTASSTTLISTPWVWSYSLREGEDEIQAPAGEFVLVFADDLTYTSSTDCNMLAGSYVSEDGSLRFEPPIATKMFCAHSLESEYTSELLSVDSFAITETTLRLEFEGGTMVFESP